MVRPGSMHYHEGHVWRMERLVDVDNIGVEFYRIIRAGYTVEEWRSMAIRAEAMIRVARIRGLIPWEYDGQRDEAA